MKFGPTLVGCRVDSNTLSAERRKEEACSRRDGETVSGNDEERLAPDVVNASEISGTALD